MKNGEIIIKNHDNNNYFIMILYVT